MTIQEMGERRESVRLNFVTDVVVTVEPDRTVRGRLKDLGMGGLLFSSSEEIDAGTPCIIEIIVPDKNSKLSIQDVKGDVVRCSGGEIAIRFWSRFEWLALFHVYNTKSE